MCTSRSCAGCTTSFSCKLILVVCEFPEQSVNKGKCKLWRLSFSEIEKEIILHADGKLQRSKTTSETCRKVILRLLKDDLSQIKLDLGKALCSYHIKTVFLHYLDKVPDDSSWTDQEPNVRRRYVGALRLLLEHVKRRHLPHYFISNVNLINETLLDRPTWDSVEKYFTDRLAEYSQL